MRPLTAPSVCPEPCTTDPEIQCVSHKPPCGGVLTRLGSRLTARQLVARQMVDRDFVPSYDNALQTLMDIRYDRWRDFDPEDSLRFYTLRMQETGMIKSSPQQIIADGTDWRFLDELKRELKT